MKYVFFAHLLALRNPYELNIKAFVKENDLKERVQIVGDIADLAAGGGGVPPQYDAVISDVFFNGSVLGWHNLVFWYHVHQLNKDGRISGDLSSLAIIQLIPQGRR